MKYYFNSSEISEGENIALLEDLTFECEYIEGSGLKYKASGKATVDGEVYTGFEIEFELEKIPEAESCSAIFNSDWAEYDYIFPV